MAQKKQLERVLELLINEDIDNASALLHQFIVEKSRVIYESIVDEDEEEMDDEEVMEAEDTEVGGDPDEDFTDEIAVDKDEIDADELMDGEPEDEEGSEDDAEFDAEFGDDGEEGSGADDERIDDLEDQLAQLRAEFDALMTQEMDEPQHDDLAGELGDISGDFDDAGEVDNDFGSDEMMMNSMYESKTKKKHDPREKKGMSAKELRDKKGEEKHKGKTKVEEETQFTKRAGDTGQRSPNPGFAGTGKNTPKGAENDKTPFTKAPSKPSYGGDPVDFTKGTGGEYGKFNAGCGEDDTPSDNVNQKQKSVPATDRGDKWAGTGKESGNFGQQNKRAPLTKAPKKPM